MIHSIDPKAISQQELHSILLTAVAPRPICFASTVNAKGQINLSPFSYFNVFSSNPPILIFSPARSGRDNSLKHTHENVKEVPEVVINMVNHAMVEQMSLASTAYAKGVNEFTKAGLTPVPSELIQPPRVAEAPVALECTVKQIIELAQTPGAGNLVICEVKRIHIQTAYYSNNQLDTKKLDLVGRMGGSWYIRANGDALFEIPKPIQNKGLGVDALPKGIRESSILTGNNLGRLGNLAVLPDQKAIDAMAKDPKIMLLTNKNKQPNILNERLHQLAKEILEAGDTSQSIRILMYAETL